jgi:dipeptidyl aminopeptidase/acylaminoacyl peptidase
MSAALLMLMIPVVSAIERLPVEDFARDPFTSRARLSPDGKHMAFLRDFNGRTMIHVANLQNNSLTRLDPGDALLVNDAPKEVGSYTWISDRRLMLVTTVLDSIYGVVAVNLDGNGGKAISGYEDNRINLNGTKFFAREVVHAFNDKNHTVLMLDRHEGGAGNPNRPDVIKVNTLTGVATTALKNPGEVVRFGFDHQGVARFGVLSHGEQSGAIYRADEKSPWQTILPLKKRDGQMHPLGLDLANGGIFVSDLTPAKRWAVYSLNPASGALGEPLLSDPKYDIIPERYSPAIDGVSLAGPIFSEQKKTLAGIRYYTESPRVKWFDPDFMKYQAAADKRFPDTVNLLVDQSRDGRRFLWLAFSDQNPGSYHLLDLDQKSFRLMGVVRPWIDPAKMAPMLAVKYEARDGLLIHGYLTVPVGHAPKDLPLVVMPHGGPWVRDIWGYSPMVQLLANRGYAVLQMNYRGSTGYGDELYQQARREIGGKIQDDIEDATRWAIAAGVADPKRIAIMGGSYGGYSALFALGHNPELYRCGVSIAGVTDWPAIYEDSDVAESKSATRYWREQIGDPAKDKDLPRLRAVSPVNFADKIVAPVLIIQGKADARVPEDQAKRMIAALEKEGRKPESLFLSGVGHSHGQPKDRVKIYNQVVAFLETNLGPGVP